MEFINIWDFPYKTSVSLDKEFLRLIKQRLKDKYEKVKIAFGKLDTEITYSYFKQILSPNSRGFKDLKVMVGLCNILDIPLANFQKNILAYRTSRGMCVIRTPKLPVTVTPIFDMIVGHIFGDGNSVKTEGREMYFNYRQYDKELRDLFIKKVEDVFGTIRYRNNYFDSLKRVYLPTIISSVIANYYSLKSEDFLSDRCTIPDKMFLHPKEHLLAFLVALIIDEGYIDSAQIVVSLYNRKLILDLGKICQQAEYDCTIKQDAKIKKKWILYILADGTRKFWRDYSNLKKMYPSICMGYKEERVENFILRKGKKWRTLSENATKNSIIELLKGRAMTINELSKILLISRQGIRFHVKYLERRGLVAISGKGKENSNLYKLLKEVKLPVKGRSKSRQYGSTSSKITQLLAEFGKLDTKTIGKKLGMKRGTIYTILRHMEKKHKIRHAGVKFYRTHPAIVWSLT